mmetsp:Transcript_49606/g.98049  ORF Transcript_49606/g.98049 Transcript_49606/m.98049 type:complete len:218 (+) Transcript_49606:87-740(+)
MSAFCCGATLGWVHMQQTRKKLCELVADGGTPESGHIGHMASDLRGVTHTADLVHHGQCVLRGEEQVVQDDAGVPNVLLHVGVRLRPFRAAVSRREARGPHAVVPHRRRAVARIGQACDDRACEAHVADDQLTRAAGRLHYIEALQIDPTMGKACIMHLSEAPQQAVHEPQGLAPDPLRKDPLSFAALEHLAQSKGWAPHDNHGVEGGDGQESDEKG